MQLTKKEFALLIGVAEKNLPVYYKEPRRKFCYVDTDKGENARVDCSMPINADFIKRRIADMKEKGKEIRYDLIEKIGFTESDLYVKPKIKIEPTVKEVIAEPVVEVVEPEPIKVSKVKKQVDKAPQQAQSNIVNIAVTQNNDNVANFEINARILLLEEQKLQQEVIEKTYKNAQKAGELIQKVGISPIISEYTLAWRESVKNSLDAFVVDVARECELSLESTARLKTMVISRTNEAGQKAEDIAIAAIERKAFELAAKNGIGEKK